MQETERQDQETSSEEADIEEEEVFFRDVSQDLDDEERSSYAVLLILAVGGFAVGALLLGITWSSVRALHDYAGEWAWVLAPVPMLLFGLASIWQYEANWLQRLGAAALGFALAQYVMIAIALSALEI